MEGRLPNGQFAKGNKHGIKPFEVGHTLSRKYDPKYCDEIIEYFSKPIAEEREDINGKVYTITNDFPTIYGFAASIGVVTNTLKNWCKGYPEFADAYQRAEEIQKHKLFAGSMSKKYDPSMSKFLASGWWGISEKVQNDTNMTVEVKMNKEFEEESQ